jgi:hypothetical protein
MAAMIFFGLNRLSRVRRWSQIGGICSVAILAHADAALSAACTISTKDINTIPGVTKLGISRDAPNFHSYSFVSDVCVDPPPTCNAINVFDALTRFPAPSADGKPVSTGSRTVIAAFGTVEHDVNQDCRSVANLTRPDHLLYPGVVFRQVAEEQKKIGVGTFGVGTGPMGPLNARVAARLWSFWTKPIREHVQSLSK